MTSTSVQLKSLWAKDTIPIHKDNFPTPLTNIQVLLESNGAVWEGQVLSIDLYKAIMVVEGFPVVATSQALHLRLLLDGRSLEFHGKICAVSQMVNGNGWFGTGAKIDLVFDDMEIAKTSQFQRILRRLIHQPGIAYLYAQTVARNTGNTLLEVRHSKLVSDLQNIEGACKSPRVTSFNSALDQVSRTHPLGEINIIHQITTPKIIEPTIRSTQIEITNAHGRRISAYSDCLLDSSHSNRPLVVISPGYGETKREYLTLAYYLAANGFHVLRYDHTNHVGDSDGDHINTTLSSIMSDQRAVLEFVGEKWPGSPQILIASSLAGRVAIKTVSQYHKLRGLVVLVGIMDVQESLATVHQEDLVAAYRQGDYPSVANVLGLNVSEQFLKDVTENEFDTLASTLLDTQKITIPVTLFSAEHDTWVRSDSVSSVYATLRNAESNWYVIPEALHRLPENPRKAKAVYLQVVASCQKTFGLESREGAIVQPSRKQIGRQNRIEKETVKNRNSQSHQVNSEFWRDYLDHFNSISKCPDYLSLLDHVSRLLGPFHSGQRILDAGCGNGDFGLFFLINQLHLLTLRGNVEGKPIHYFAVDLILDAVKRARRDLSVTANQVLEQFPNLSRSQIPTTDSLANVNLNDPLPFRDNYFDRIVCNLVVGYLENQRFTISELFRVLAPHGKMVITNLKPEGDFSPIYQNLVRSTQKYEELREARELLNNYGKIRRAEKDGIFQFLGKQQWSQLLASVGAKRTQIYPTFANQAYIVVVEKPGRPDSQRMTEQGSNAILQNAIKDRIDLGLVA